MAPTLGPFSSDDPARSARPIPPVAQHTAGPRLRAKNPRMGSKRDSDAAGSSPDDGEHPEATSLGSGDDVIAPTVVEYVGGPYDGRREAVYAQLPPTAVFVGGESGGFGRGVYERGAGPGDDGILRYEWQKT